MTLALLPVRDALDFGPRPDPARGIFETILLRDGQPIAADAHRARIESSARALYGIELPADLSATIHMQAQTHRDGRMRLGLRPDGSTTVEAAPLGPDPRYTALAPFVLPGGIGPHKYSDRRLLDAIAQAAGPQALPLLMDADGAVLEATWANLLIESGGRLISPPDDGRALAGIGRRRLRYDEEPVQLDRLLAADALYLTSALRTVSFEITVSSR